MNTDKTRIMTTISGQSILPALINSNPSIGLDLQQAITEYSTKNGEIYEETKGKKIAAEIKRGKLVDREIVAKLVGRLKNIHQNQFLISKAKIAANISKIFGFTDPGMTTKIEENLYNV